VLGDYALRTAPIMCLSSKTYVAVGLVPTIRMEIFRGLVWRKNDRTFSRYKRWWRIAISSHWLAKETEAELNCGSGIITHSRWALVP
jgi:hypothetical protein